MKITFDNNSIMRSALNKVQQGNYFDALCLFARVDSYESMLNQIGCMCKLRDIAYACDVHRLLLSKYHSTHNCYDDMLLLGAVVDPVLAYSESDRPDGEVSAYSASKISADASLVGDYSTEMDDDIPHPDLDYASDMPFWDIADNNKFYDVKSTQYLDMLRLNIEKAYFDDDKQQARRLTNQLLQSDTDHVPTLEAQISLCLFEEKYKKGVQYAVKLADMDGCSAAGIGSAVEVLLHEDNQKYLPQIAKLLNKALAFEGEITSYDLENYVEIANDYLHDSALSAKFATMLYGMHKTAGLESIKVCICAFFNDEQFDMAREASLTLCYALPWDGYAQMLLAYVNNHMQGNGRDRLFVGTRLIRHFCLPTQIVALSEVAIATKPDEIKTTLIQDDYARLSALYGYCRYLILQNEANAFVSVASLLRTVTKLFAIQNKDHFIDFAKRQLSAILPEPSLGETLLSRLIELGYRSTVVIGVRDSYYQLDLSNYDLNDQVFCDAFSLCATIKAVQVSKMVTAYAKLKTTLCVDFSDKTNVARSVAFCLLCLTDKKFAKSLESELFAEEEKQLYQDFLDAQQLKD